MATPKISALIAWVALLCSVVFTLPARAATSGQNGTHDPSRMIESDGRLYVYSTGGGSKSSPDGLVWTNGPALFPNGYPAWVHTAVANDEGIWAPDVIYTNGQYYLFYSLANTSNACALGVMTSPTLNPSSSAFKWTDHGLVVSNTGSATYCTIDPAPVLDAAGNLWVVWGSGYSHATTADTIWVTRLDNSTGLPSSADSAKPGHPLSKGHEEAGYMYFHSGYYYLWYNTGGCCDGASSTYTIHVTRSQSITGPFSGDKTFYASNGSIHGPGHMGIYSACGVERFTYHYYPDTGGSVLGENELSWGSDGWPIVGAQSTTPIKPCSDAGSAGAGGATAGGGVGGSLGQAGSAGSAEQGGQGGVAGANPGVGGVGNVGGELGSAGSAVGSAGASTAGASAAGASTGGTGATGAGTAGASNMPAGGDSGAATPGAGDSESGCTCSLPHKSSSNANGAFAALAAAALIASRRRRGRASSSR